MILEKLDLTKEILEKYPDTRGDKQTGKFLNRVLMSLNGNMTVDFTEFSVESWTRTRRLILERCPYLDNRTSLTNKLELQMKSEVRR